MRVLSASATLQPRGFALAEAREFICLPFGPAEAVPLLQNSPGEIF
jgi:hypothetical protein